MKINVEFFKPSGKFYTEETVEVPDEVRAWEVRPHIRKHLGDRLRGCSAYVSARPFGFPMMLHPSEKGGPL